jgi:hypothetical protein
MYVCPHTDPYAAICWRNRGDGGQGPEQCHGRAIGTVSWPRVRTGHLHPLQLSGPDHSVRPDLAFSEEHPLPGLEEKNWRDSFVVEAESGMPPVVGPGVVGCIPVWRAACATGNTMRKGVSIHKGGTTQT